MTIVAWGFMRSASPSLGLTHGQFALDLLNQLRQPAGNRHRHPRPMALTRRVLRLGTCSRPDLLLRTESRKTAAANAVGHGQLVVVGGVLRRHDDTAICGNSTLSGRGTSGPLMSGSATSIRTTSGWCSRAAGSAAAPSAASPTTVHPSRSRARRSVARKRGWSSTISTPALMRASSSPRARGRTDARPSVPRQTTTECPHVPAAGGLAGSADASSHRKEDSPSPGTIGRRSAARTWLTPS
jgi:hypothetical protein